MKIKNFTGLLVFLSASGALMAPLSAQPMASTTAARVFLEPINVESCDARARTATFFYSLAATNPAPSLGEASTSPEAVVLDAPASTLLTLPLARNAVVMHVDAQGKMSNINLRRASAALAAKTMTLRAEFSVAKSGQLQIIRLIATDV